MANTAGVCVSFLKEAMDATGHNLGGAGDTIKAALYLATATISKATAAYTVTGEVSGSGYTAGGVTVTHANGATAGTDKAYWTPSASIVYTGVTLATAFDCVLIYNSTKTDKAISVHTFASQTITAGDFTLTMPTNNETTGLVRLGGTPA